ncbi:uncharacterized protein EKO05_0006833 [Ascochyta rabiei]|uniref:uncharacterized protein n=1 Tax=Didymella rabiei TaxID=5454 RepID=UPI001902A11F|nr:uncharacterized protein EKO05_0006833 [Ascochyta rabiei]UPX16434.1 hypothetical protein EKO05_0006833 [Ascochyta rabiei]
MASQVGSMSSHPDSSSQPAHARSIQSSRTSTPRSRSSSASSASSDTTMLDAPTHLPLAPARPRQASVSLPQSAPSASSSPSSSSFSSSAQPPPADPAFSLLLSLPRELRDRIYTFALTAAYPFWWPSHAPAKHDVAVSLLQTCKQLHDEAAPVLYTANKFLFTHPSDCNIFRVVASPHADRIHSVWFRIREKDLRLWTAYLSSKSADRSLKADLPRLKNLCIFMRCLSLGTPRLLGLLGVQGAGGAGGAGGVAVLPPPMAVQVQAVQNAVGQQVAALHQQFHHLAHAVAATGPPVIVPTGAHPGQHLPPIPPHTPAAAHANTGPHHHAQPPPPPPPPPAVPFAAFAAGAVPHHHPQPPAPAAAQGHPNLNVLTTFLRFERELGIESLCMSLRETLHDPSHRVVAHQPTAPAGADARGGHRERRRQDREREQERDRRNAQSEHGERDKSGDTDTPREIPDVKIVCIMRVPKPEVSRLVRMYPEELSVDRNGDARTRFRRLRGADVCVEISGFEGVQG